MSRTAQWIIDNCNAIVMDVGGVKWGNSWLSYINAGQTLVADIIPEALTKTTVEQLSPGVSQECPAGAARFLGMANNQGSDGTTPGDAITICDEDVLSSFNPGWMSEPGSTTIENFMFNENSPVSFKVYPPVHKTTPVFAGLRYVDTPVDCIAADSLLSVPDKYSVALLEWCLYMALSSETDARDPGKANGHLSSFFNILGVKEKNRIKYSPNIHDRAGIPPPDSQIK